MLYPSLNEFNVSQADSNKIINVSKGIVKNIKNNLFINSDNQIFQKDSLNQKSILLSDSRYDSDSSFIYQYKSKNYYGTLDITDYQPSVQGFNEFQKPSNVNIKGVPWEESQFILSIVFPVYNKVAFLDRVFKSILDFANNPLKNPLNEKIEFVIVDANSDDGSYEYAVNLAKSLNNPSNKNIKQKSHQKKVPIQKVNNDIDEQDSINSVISSFLTENKNKNPTKTFRYRSALISFHNQESPNNNIDKKASDQETNTKISYGKGSNVKVRVVRRNEKTLSIITRQIGVEYATGRYIWQIDPDDEVVTSSMASIVDELRKEIEDPKKFVPNKIDSNDDTNPDSRDIYIKQFEDMINNDAERINKNDPPADMIEIGYCQYTYQDGVLPETPNCFPRYTHRIGSNYKIAERLVTETTPWQLWQCIIKRDIFLKAIESIKLHSPNQTKIIVADDLFIYSATAYHAKVLKEVNLIGYIYYYMNPNSESLKIYKDNLNTRLSAKVIVSFMHYLYDDMKLEFHQRYSEL